MNKKEFARTQAVGRKLREIFDRDKAPFSAGCEDYLVRAVEEAQGIEKASDLFHSVVEMIKPDRPLKVDDVYDDDPHSVFCEECTNTVNRRDAEKVFDEILMKIVWKCKGCLYG